MNSNEQELCTFIKRWEKLLSIKAVLKYIIDNHFYNILAAITKFMRCYEMKKNQIFELLCITTTVVRNREDSITNTSTIYNLVNILFKKYVSSVDGVFYRS